ncbi:6855_t:CDS:10 [Paraglomus brasilianum]|uniref:6855_t:CDS:1 n=1 Tax=Paraglomus brasilianum TaxID=144538 RepID=A0A9N9CNF2_9GLOM|nr:6855_t:CDS:10 [Paraglomus brasilianum]
MFLYNITLQPPASINCAVVGHFSGTKQQEIVISRVTRLELWRVDPTTRKLQTLLTQDVFGIIRSLTPFRLTGGSKDYIIVGSDSGRIVILEYNPQKNKFTKVHQETFGKSGCRRIVPGQYLAVDPKGRSAMIGAIEKQKLVYILNRDSAANLTISSPLEAHKSHTIVHHCIGLDVGYENPVFACLEVDYSEADQDHTGEAFISTEKMLTYYELDLGLNHVVRKWSDPVDARANMLFPVPGGNDGPSGVLVCSENFITYKHQRSPSLRIPIPRRRSPLEDPGRGLIIVSGVMHKMKGFFFFLLQSEEGDVYKVTLEYDSDTVTEIKIKYFDTLPVAASLCILRAGFLFVGAEFGDHRLYSFTSLGDNTDEPEYSSSDFNSQDDTDPSFVYFVPRELRNLELADALESLCPMTDAKVLNLTDDDTPQIYALCGRGAGSSFRILRHGLEVSEIAVSELPGNPNAVWTTKLRDQDEYDAYIIVSFVNATLVLSIGETVEEVTDTGFLSTTPTIDVHQLGDDALLQIYPQGIRHIRADRRVNEWRTPGNRAIVKATTNKNQVIIALTGGEIVYFELDNQGQLNEYQDRRQMNVNVNCLAVGEVPEGRKRAKFLAVGCADNTVRIISLDPESTLEVLSTQALTAPPYSLSIIEMFDIGTDATHGTFYLNIGLQNGVLLRTVLDNVTGQLTDTRQRFLGARPVKLFHVRVQNAPAVLALSSRPWLSYTFQSRLHLTPLSYDLLEHGSNFTSPQVPEGIVAISANTLRIFTVEKLGTVFNQASLPLKYTPRHFINHAQSKNFVIIETEHNTYSPSEKEKVLKMKETEGFEIDEKAVNLPPDTFGLPKYESGKWASCIRVVNPFQGETTHLIELEDNEAAFSIATVSFHNHSNVTFLVVGTAKDANLAPRTCTFGFIHVYRFINDGNQLELVHKTSVDDIPMALLAFQGRLLAGVGKALRIYDCGKRKLLRKCETKAIPNCVVGLHTQGNRIIVNDIQESIHYASYRPHDNRIIIFADDTTPRWVTTSVMVDYDTIAGGDKFGNFFIDRLPSETSEEVDEDPTGNKIMYEKGYLMGAPHKIQIVCQYHVGDILTSLQRTTLVAGGREILLYTGFMGNIGVFVPFITKEDVDFFQALEMHMRQEAPPLTGRDHLMYRSFYAPVKAVIDGDLCEQYNLLPMDKKRAIAQELDRTPAEIQKKIEDMRVLAAF